MKQRLIPGSLALGALLFTGCLDAGTGLDELSGTFLATIFVVTPTGQAPINVLAAGGSLRIVITAAGVTSGELSMPASVTGGAPFSASMAGTANVNLLTVTFTQAADSFVRDLTWSREGSSVLAVTEQVAGDASFTITLVRQ